MKDKDTLYARWLSGDLEPDERSELQSSGVLKELEDIVKLTDRASLPKYNLEQELSRLQANLPTKQGKVRRLNPWVIGIAASMLLILSLFFLFQPRSTTIEADSQRTINHTFAEGSSVILNDGSNIQYQATKWEEERRLQLEGEAFFEVEKGLPFIVETNKGQVAVLGTSFNVRSWGTRLLVDCYSGKVQVTGFGQSVELTPGQGTILSPDAAPISNKFTRTAPDWTNGESNFNSASLTEVFAELERQFGVTVAGNIPNKRFSGSFAHNNLDAAVRDVCQPQGIDYTISTDKKVITLQ